MPEYRLKSITSWHVVECRNIRTPLLNMTYPPSKTHSRLFDLLKENVDEFVEEKEGKRSTLRKIRKTLEKKEGCTLFVATSNESRKESG